MKKPLIVICPACKKSVTWNAQFPERPFCSARCKSIDLGAWAAKKYKIAGSSTPLEQTEDVTE